MGCSHRDVSAARKIISDRGITAGTSDGDLAGPFPDRWAWLSAGYDVLEFGQEVKSMRTPPHFTLSKVDPF